LAHHLKPLVGQEVAEHLPESAVVVCQHHPRAKVDGGRTVAPGSGGGHHASTCSGSTALIRVPPPGRESTSHRPPVISTRSRMASSPKWVPLSPGGTFSNPLPLSLISRATDPFSRCSVNTPREASACLATLVRASC